MNSQAQILDKKRVSPADIPDFVMLQIESFFVTYEDSACDLGAAIAKSGKTCDQAGCLVVGILTSPCYLGLQMCVIVFNDLWGFHL